MSDHERALTYLQMNRPEEAVTYARKAVASQPESPWFLATLLQALIEARRSGEALKEGRAALVVAPDDANLHKLTGIAAYEEGRFEQAREHLERSLQLWPEDPASHAVLAKTLAHLRKKGEALGHAHRAITLAPEDAFAHRARGDVYVELRDWHNAQVAYRRALELDPEDTYVHTNLGYVLQESGDREAAVEHTVNAARLDPTNKVATDNVVAMGRAAVAGSGFVIYLLFRLGLGAARIEEWRAGLLVLLALGVTGLVVYRRVQERKLPPVVREAVRSQRRLDGPLPTPVWLLLGVGGCVAAGGVAGRLVDGETLDGGTEWAQLAVGFALAAGAAYFVRRRMRLRNLADYVGWTFALWAFLAGIATLVVVWALVGIVMPGDSFDSRGDAVSAFVGAAPIAAIFGYIALAKRPGRVTAP